MPLDASAYFYNSHRSFHKLYAQHPGCATSCIHHVWKPQAIATDTLFREGVWSDVLCFYNWASMREPDTSAFNSGFVDILCILDRTLQPVQWVTHIAWC